MCRLRVSGAQELAYWGLCGLSPPPPPRDVHQNRSNVLMVVGGGGLSVTQWQMESHRWEWHVGE